VRSSAMSWLLPPTNVESKSISLATYHDRSGGQITWGDCGRNQSGAAHSPKERAARSGPVNRK